MGDMEIKFQSFEDIFLAMDYREDFGFVFFSPGYYAFIMIVTGWELRVGVLKLHKVDGSSIRTSILYT